MMGDPERFLMVTAPRVVERGGQWATQSEQISQTIDSGLHTLLWMT